MRPTAMIASVAALVGGSVVAFAHVPYLEECEHGDYGTERPFELGSPIEHSVALYAYLDSVTDVDVIHFTLREEDFDPSLRIPEMGGERDAVVADPEGNPGRLLHFGSLVPACSAYENALLRVALVGPEQPSLPPYDGAVELPFELHQQQGVHLIDNQDQGRRWYEFFTGKWYFYQKTVDLILTEPGDYWLYYWPAAGAPADYVAEVGDAEFWGLPEILRALWYEWLLIHDGELHDISCAMEL